MRRLVLLVAGIVMSAPVGVPAHAAGPYLAVDYVRLIERPVDAGDLVAVACHASAVPTATMAPLATAVWCSVNGRSASRVVPGRDSVVTVDAVVFDSYDVCISGQAAFMDAVTDEMSLAQDGPHCTTYYL
jgi:hypothetical protein